MAKEWKEVRAFGALVRAIRTLIRGLEYEQTFGRLPDYSKELNQAIGQVRVAIKTFEEARKGLGL